MAKMPAVVPAGCFALGIAVVYFGALPAGGLLAFFAVSLLAAILWRNRPLFYIWLGLMLVAAGGVRYAVWQEDNLQHPVQQFLPVENTDAEAIVVEPPAKGRRGFPVEIRKITSKGQTLAINRRFYLRTAGPVKNLRPGDRLFLKNVGLKKLPFPRNPGQFDFGKYLKHHGIMGIMESGRNSQIEIESGYESSLQRYLFGFRNSLVERIFHILPEKSAGFLSAVLLGEKQQIDADIKTDFQNSGVAHVLAISGLHVGFVFLVFYLLFSFLPLSFRWQNSLSLLFLVLYMFLTGANPPVVRATLMIAIYLLGVNSERKPDAYNTVFVAALLILLYQPQQLFRAGFQFSFIAVLSILFFYRQFKPVIEYLGGYFPAGKTGNLLRKTVLIPFFVSLAAQLGTVPLMAVYFHKIPVISFVLNLVVIPLTGLIVPVGFVALLMSFLYLPLGAMIGGFLSAVVRGLIALVHFSAELPGAYFETGKIPAAALLLYLLLIGLIILWKSRKSVELLRPGSVFAVLLLLWTITPLRTPTEIWMLDVGQGDAGLLRTSSGRTVLIDCGSAYKNWDNGENVILPALREFGISRLNKVIITHPHGDHIGGLFSLLERVKIDSVYLPALKTGYFLQDSLLKRLRVLQIPYRLLQIGDHSVVDHAVRLYFLAPFPQDLAPAGTSGREINNSSLVSLIKIRDSGLLFMGDAEPGVERKLMHWGNLLHAPVIKLGHHGSATSSSPFFLRAVSPRVGLISVGAHNRYNHPSAAVLASFSQNNIKYYRTDRSGAVCLRFRGGKWEKSDWR